MKILLLTPYCPVPPNSGGRIRIWEEIRFLSIRHRLTLISFYQTDAEYNHREALDRYCDRVIMVRRPDAMEDIDTHDMRQLSDLFKWYSTPDMDLALATVSADQFDVVLFEHIFMAQYETRFSTTKILQEHNIESTLFKQIAHSSVHPTATPDGTRERAFRMSRWMLMRQYENQTWPKFSLRVTVSERDKAELDSRCRTGRTTVVPNGINARDIRLIPESTWLRTSPRKMLFMGALDFYPNIDCLRFLTQHILPIVRKSDPGITLVIAGRNPPDSILGLSRQPGIDVVADPDDIDAVARDSYLNLVPVRIGSGTRIKILHSMALGLPVVSTTLGCEGLDVTDGHHLLIRDTPESFAEAVLTLIGDVQLAMRLRAAGRTLVEERYDWSLVFERLEREMLHQVAGSA